MNAFATLLFLSPLQGPLFGMSGVEDFILTDKQAYMVLPPQAIASSQTVYMEWSPSGRYLLMKQMRPYLTPSAVVSLLQGERPPDPVVTLCVWDKDQQRTVEIGRIRNDLRPGAFYWFAGTDIATDLVEELVPSGPNNLKPSDRISLLRLDCAKATMSFIPLYEKETSTGFLTGYMAPTLPRALYIEQEFIPKTRDGSRPEHKAACWVYFIDSDGRTTQRVHIPKQSFMKHEWVSGGDKVLLTSSVPGDFPGPTEQTLLDVRTGKVLQPDPTLKPYVPPIQSKRLNALLLPAQTTIGTITRGYRSAWLKSSTVSEQMEYLLSPRANSVMLNDPQDAVAILDQGVVTVRLLAAVPKELFLQARSAAEKAKALSEVKQIGTAAHIFAADNDDRFPSQDEFQNKALSPYLKNDGFFDGFTYTFGGGSIRDLKNPSGTVLGYKPVAGGFAVVFADGHAKWLNELPKNP